MVGRRQYPFLGVDPPDGMHRAPYRAHNKKGLINEDQAFLLNGAGNEIRTRDVNLGKIDIVTSIKYNTIRKYDSFQSVTL